MKHRYYVQGERIMLSPMEEYEIENLRMLRNKCRYYFADVAEIYPDAQSKWYMQYLNRLNDYMFSVFQLPYRKWIGAVAVYDVNLMELCATFGRLMIDHDKADLRGLGVDVVMGISEFARLQLHLNLLYLEVRQDNPAAIITYLKSGFIPIRMSESKPYYLYMKKNLH